MSPAPAAYLEQLGDALDHLTDWNAIERAGRLLVGEVYGTLVPVGGVRDLGRDAVALVLADKVSHLVLAVSADKDWRDKIRRVAERVREAGEPIDILVYCTPVPLRDDSDFQRLRAELAASGIRLEPPLGREWWLERLARDTAASRAVRREILRLLPFHPGHFRTADEYEEQYGEQAGVVLTELVGRDDVRLRLEAALRTGRVVLLHGDRGLGKTRMAVAATRAVDGRFVSGSTRGDEPTLIDDLATTSSTTIAVDDAHARPDLVRRLVSAASDPRIGRPEHLLIVTWSSMVPVVRALVGTALPIEELSLQPLEREQLAQILKAPPIALADPILRGRVLDASGGYPLYAVMGARALAGGADPERLGTNPLEAYLDTAWSPARGRAEARVLALAALVGGLRVVDDMGVITDAAREAATRLQLSDDDLVRALNALAEAGLLGLEDGRYVLRPDAIARVILKRVCLTPAPHADVRVLLALAAPQWDRALSLLTELYDESDDQRIRVAVREVLDEMLPAPDADAQAWSTFLGYVRASALLLPEDAIRWSRAALAAETPPGAEFIGYRMVRPDVRRAIVAVAQRTKYRELRRSVELLLSVAEEEPFEYRNAGISQRNAPAIHELLELASATDAYGRQPEIPGFVRDEMRTVIAPWWRVSAARADLAVLVLGNLLDPAVSGAFMDPDSHDKVNLIAGQMSGPAYAAAAAPLVAEIRAVLPSTNARGGCALLAVLDDVVRTAKGHPHAFNVRPDDALQAAARAVACELLAAFRQRFASNAAMQVRAHHMQDDLGCDDAAAAPEDADDYETLFMWTRHGDLDDDERRRGAHTATMIERLRNRSVDDVIAWYASRVRGAAEAGLQQTHYAASFLRDLTAARLDLAVPLARALHADPITAGYGHVPLDAAARRGSPDVAALLGEWAAGEVRDRWVVWAFLVQDPAGAWQRTPELVRTAFAHATEAEADMVDTFLLRLAGAPGESEALGYALRADAPLVRRVGASYACLLSADQRHPHHIPLRPDDRSTFESVLLNDLATPLPRLAPAILPHRDDMPTELAQLDPALAMRWVRARLAALETHTDGFVDAFSPADIAGLQALRGRANADGLLDDYAALTKPWIAAAEGWNTVLRHLLPDPQAAVLARLRAGGLVPAAVERLLELVGGRGDGWPDLIDAAADLLTEDELSTAVARATSHRGVVSGSFVPVMQALVDFFDGIARDGRPRVARIGQRLAASYRKRVEDERRRDHDRQFDR